jgi:acyl dehydratase
MSAPKLYWDDLHVGLRFLSGTAIVDADDLKQFATMFDPQPFHLHDDEARATIFKGLAASGWHTAALTMRLMVESVPLAEGIIGTSGELTWPRPTRPGDTLQVESEFIALSPSRSNPMRGSATLKTTTRNQNAYIVQTFTCKIVVARRPAREPVAPL